MRHINTYLQSRTSQEWYDLMLPNREKQRIAMAAIFGITPYTASRWRTQDAMPKLARMVAALYIGELTIADLEDIAEEAI